MHNLCRYVCPVYAGPVTYGAICYQYTEYVARKYRMEGNFGSGKILRSCCKTDIGGIKIGKFSHPQAENYLAKLQRNF